jgi:hypothetical protein
MEIRQFSMRDALKLLDIKPPGVSKKQSQADIDTMVEAWKENELADHFKLRRRDAHPDRPDGDEDLFKDLTTAFEEIKANLKLRKPKTPPEQVTDCRSCNASRIPKDAAHCYECGLGYKRKVPWTECPTCATERNPTRAKFCFACGFDYQVPDGFLERLRSVGYTDSDIAYFTNSGQIARWRKMPPTSKELGDNIHFELQKRKIMRGGRGDFGGLFGGR